MKYLTSTDYDKFIFNIVYYNFNEKQIADYFWSEYLQHKEYNIDFLNELRNKINFVKNRIEEITETNQPPEDITQFLSTNWQDEIDIELANGFIPLDFIFKYKFQNWEDYTISNDNIYLIDLGYDLLCQYIEQGYPQMKKINTELTLKQKTILLDEIGFLSLEKTNSLTQEKKAELLAIILNSSKQNIRENLIYLHSLKGNQRDMDVVKATLYKVGL
jgi:hypothetical protein